MGASNNSFESPYRPVPLENWLRESSVQTLPQLFSESVEKSRHQDFLGAKVAGSYLYQTYGDIDKRAQEFAAALLSLGIEKGDRVAQLSSNRPEWVITDLATMRIGGVHVPLFTDQSESSLFYYLEHSQSRVLVLEGEQQRNLVLGMLDRLPHLETLIIHDAAFPLSEESSISSFSFQDTLNLGASQLSEQKDTIERRSAELQGTDVCSLVYTSGTSGQPKAVMLMHGNFLSNALAIRSRVDARPGEIALSILPLSHVLERSILYLGISVGGTMAFAEDLQSIGQNFQEVKPHFVTGVPRLYEKVLEKIQGSLADEKIMPRMKRRFFDWALRRGASLSKLSPEQKRGPLLEFQHRLADKVVLQKIKQRMGGRVRILASGGAPLSPDVAEFYRAVGFKMVEGYGLTETSPVVTMNALLHPVPETVGKTLGDVEIRLEEDDEISVRGPNLMLGYFRDAEATSRVIDQEGWFRTGDLGRITGTGHLSIVGRKKDLIVLSSGKNVAPSPIEQSLVREPMIDQALVIGDQRKFIAALITPHPEKCLEWLKKNGKSADKASLHKQPELRKELLRLVVKACESLPKFQQVKKIAVLPRPFSDEFGEITSTLKLKRDVIVKNFATHVESIYQD